MVSLPKHFLNTTALFCIDRYNQLVRRFRAPGPQDSDPDLSSIRARAEIGTDISSHLETIFLEGIRARPRLIVELGVRGGESTFVLEKVACRYQATLVSVDIEDYSLTTKYEKWHFVQEDDLVFGEGFGSWCASQGLDHQVDLLLVDTSHEYLHTLAEIRTWMPHLGARAVAIFHDTNLKKLYRRRDGSIGLGWNNNRGVTRALEEFLGSRIDETVFFERQMDGWHVVHDPLCNGLTILRRTLDA